MKDKIYRHPERWGNPRRFERHHDLYALVCYFYLELEEFLLISKGILLLEIGCWKSLSSMDPKHADFESTSDPKVLQKFLLNTASGRLQHAAGTKYADAIRVCFDNLKTSDYEDWQLQRLIREKVWNPLREGC
jgi:hypothetical protein